MTISPAAAHETFDTLRDTLSAATALGLPVAAVAGMTAVEVTARGLDYDDPDVSLGIYPTKDAAVIALRNFTLERHDEMQDMAPWVDDIDEHVTAAAYDEAFTAARAAWIAGKDDEAIIATLFSADGYYFTEHVIQPIPARIV